MGQLAFVCGLQVEPPIKGRPHRGHSSKYHSHRTTTFEPLRRPYKGQHGQPQSVLCSLSMESPLGEVPLCMLLDDTGFQTMLAAMQ